MKPARIFLLLLPLLAAIGCHKAQLTYLYVKVYGPCDYMSGCYGGGAAAPQVTPLHNLHWKLTDRDQKTASGDFTPDAGALLFPSSFTIELQPVPSGTLTLTVDAQDARNGTTILSNTAQVSLDSSGDVAQVDVTLYHPSDGGPPDATTPDAGSEVGARDVGQPDARTNDAGARDAGAHDATPRDGTASSKS